MDTETKPTRPPAALDPAVAIQASVNGGALGWPDVAAAGCSSEQVAAWVARGELFRVRRGAYVLGEVWRAADLDERYRLTVMAVVRSRRGDEVVSRHSALALWGLPLWDVDRGLVTLAADVEEAHTRSGVRPLRALVSVEPRSGIALEAPADAVVTTASFSVEAGVVAGDAALHAGTVTEGDLDDAIERLVPTLRGRRRVRRMRECVDGACESPGESRTRLVLAALGLPLKSQAKIIDSDGNVVARVDFLVAGRVVVEFDGAVKYAGADGRDALVAEKVREDRLRELGYTVIRLTWADLRHPHTIRARITAALSARARVS